MNNIIIINKKKLIKQMYQQKLILKEINNKIKEINERRSNLNKQFVLKQKYDSVIPLKLFTCWHTKDLPPFMKNNVEYVKQSNPRFEHYLFDEDECRSFILNNFGHDVFNAYNNLIPDSYKADLWRYCILYINGGIYYDIKFRNINNFKFIALTEKEFFVRDIEYSGKGTLTGLISVKPKNEMMFKCIQQIVENVKNKYYGYSSLEPTGPILLGSLFTEEEKNNMELYLGILKINNNIDKLCVYYNDFVILDFYPEYRSEKQNTHYSEFWNNKNIYK
jgi:hypothetical protein